MSKSKRRTAAGSAKPRAKKSEPKTPGVSKGLTRLLTGLLVLAWIVVLAYFDLAAEEHFRTPKLILSSGLALLSLAWLTFAAADPRLPPTTPRIDLRSLLRDPSVLLGAALLAVAATGLFGEHGAHVRRAFPSLLIGVLCLIVWSRLLSDDHLRFLLRLNAFAAIVIAALIGMVNYGLYDPLGAEYRFEYAVTNRPNWAPYIGSTLDLRAFLLLPMLYAQLRIFKSAGAARFFWIAALVLEIDTLRRAEALSTILVFGVASLVLWWNLLPRKRFLYAAGLILIAVVALAEPVRDRILQIGKILSFEEQTTRDVNRLLSGRLEGWAAGVWMWQSQPMLGVGLGAYATEYGAAKLALIEAGEETGAENWFLPQAMPYFDHAHNEFIHLAAQLGAAGLAIVLAMAAWIVFRLWRKRRDAPPEDAAYQWATISGLFVLALLGFPFHVAIVAFPSLLMLSWILRPAPAGPAVEDADSNEASSAEEPASKRMHHLLTIASIFFFAFFVLHVRSGADRWQASRILRDVMQDTLKINQTSLQQRIPVLQSNLVKLEDARRLDPANAQVLIARGGQYLVLDRPEAAMETYLEAARLEPRPTIYANLGRSYDMLGRGDEAAEAYVKAVRLDHQRWVRMFRDKLPEYERDRLRRAWRELHRQ